MGLNPNDGVILRSPARFRKVFILVIIFSSFFILFSINYNLDDFRKTKMHMSSLYSDDDSYAIKTPGCHIPAMKPVNELIKEYIEYPKKLKPCPNTNYSLIKQNGTHIWLDHDTRILLHYNITKKKYKHVNCCYSSFYRPNTIKDINSHKIDERIKYNECIKFKDVKKVKDEFVKVTCYLKGKILYDQYFPFAPLKAFTRNDEDKTVHNQTEKTAYNVLVLGIDNLSRLNFHRTMPKTSQFLKNRGAIELMGYNKVGDNSFPNLVPLLMGYTMEEIKKICHPLKWTTYDDCPFLWHWYKDAGYYTAFGEDSAKLGTFNYLMKGFRKTPTDYYLHPFMAEAERLAGKHKDFNVVLCMNEYYLYQILLNYIQAITQTLRDLNLFGFFWETTMSHDDLNYPMAMDDSYLHFFERLSDSNYLDKTFIFLVSDHGMRWGAFRKTRQGYLEERLPLVNVLTPPSFRENYSEAFSNLKYNARQLTTPFDLHSTLLDLVDLDNISNEKIFERQRDSYAKERGISLFLEIPQNRTCKSAGIADHWCTCHNRVLLSNTSRETIRASDHLIDYLNYILSEYSQCAQLKLDEILQSVKIYSSLENKLKKDWEEYSVMVKVKPSDGVFEATVRNNSDNWSVVGTVSRLNLYGNQSLCIQDPRLKLYCYCTDDVDDVMT